MEGAFFMLVVKNKRSCMSRKGADIKERLFDHFIMDMVTGCWVWTSTVSPANPLDLTQGEMATRLGVDQSIVSRAANKKNWRHIS